MRKYYLASTDDRGKVDLRDYQTEIISAVHQYIPNAKVEVTERYYTVEPTPARGDAIRIGRILSSKDILGNHCVPISKLFCSEEIEKGTVPINGTKQKRTGGHQ